MKAQYTEWIERYAEGSLSAGERKKFEEALRTDTRLRDEYALHLALDDYLEAKARMHGIMNSPDWERINADAEEAVKLFFTDMYGIDLEAEVAEDGGERITVLSPQSAVLPPSQSFGGQSSPQSSVSSPRSKVSREKKLRSGRRLWLWAGAAAAVVALILIVNVSLMTRPPETEVLFAQYVQEAEHMVRRSEGMPEDVYKDIFLAIEQYESSDYEAAIQTFELIEPWRKAYPEISLFKGLIHLEIGENEVALSLFEDCAKQRSPYRKYARWLRNLAYVRLANPDSAFMFFIERSDGFYNLPSHWQRMIRAANLIGTGQFKAYRQFVNPGAEGAVVLHRDDIIWGSVFTILFLMALAVWIDLIRQRLHWKEAVPLAILQIFIPFGGPVVYFFWLRRVAREMSKERLQASGIRPQGKFSMGEQNTDKKE